MLQYNAYYDKLIDVFEEIGSILRPFSDYAENIYKDKPLVQDALAALYGDLLQFVRVAKSLFLDKKGRPKGGLGLFVVQVWQTFESQIDGIKSSFQKHLRKLEIELGVADRGTFYEETRKQSEYRSETRSWLQDISSFTGQKGKVDAEASRHAILSWLCKLDFKANHEKTFSARHESTGTWFLKTDSFQQWLQTGASALLYCAGKPGSGKSVLTSIVIEELRNIFSRGNLSIAFIYCDSRQQDYNNARLLVSSLLKQLCAAEEEIPAPVEEKYRSSLAEGSLVLTWTEVKNLLIQVLSSSKKRTIIIADGLDECDSPEEMCDLFRQCAEMIDKIVKVFVTSRSENRIIRLKLDQHPTILLDEASVKDDIASFIDAEVQSLTQSGRLSIGASLLKQEIIDSLLQRAEGMFLYVRFQLDALCYQTTDQEIRDALKTLPHGLKDVYQRALRTIDAQPSSMKVLAQKVFMWVLFAKRSLLLYELLDAIAIFPGFRTINPEHRLNDPSLVVSACAELVSVDKALLVQFTHSSVRDFLLSSSARHYISQDFLFSGMQANLNIGKACLTYLLSDDMKVQLQMLEQARAFYQGHCFSIYASSHWADHTRGSGEKDLQDLTLELLYQRDLTSMWKFWAQIWQSPDLLQCLPYEAPAHNPLLIAIQEELVYTIPNLPNLESLLEQTDSDGLSPLLYAIKHDRLLAAIAVMDCGADPKKIDPKGMTTLHYASKSAMTTPLIPRLISAGVDKHALSETNTSAFTCAAANGLLDTLKMLLDSEENSLARILAASDALSSAADEDEIPVMEYLLEVGAKVDHTDKIGWTPLQHAVHFSKTQSVLRLLIAGADPNYRNGGICTPFERAAQRGNFEIIELLLNAGANPSIVHGGTTILDWSVMSNDARVVRWALGLGISVNQQDEQGSTALIWAVQEDTDVTVLKELLHAGAYVHLKTTTDGTTALDAAAMRGNDEGVRVLLDAGAHPESKSTNGFSALTWACQNGHSNVVRLILETGSSVDIRDEEEKTPMIKAVEFGHADIVLQLIEAGADLEAKDKHSRTALNLATVKKYESLVKLLIDAGATVDVKDSQGVTPLMAASWDESETIFQILMTRKPELNLQDNCGLTALSYAASFGRVNAVRSLLVAGASPVIPSYGVQFFTFPNDINTHKY